MTLVKRRPLSTRALGTEPEVPDIPALAAWVAERRETGEAGDLTTYRITRSLVPQLDAGIMVPCAGGRFYKDRLLASFTGIEECVITGETEVAASDLLADSLELSGMKKGVWCALPSPHTLRLSDSYYGDEDEAATAVADLYRSAMRSMRDAGVGGHILLCDRADETELSALARQKVFFFCPEPEGDDMPLLMEYQHRIAVKGTILPKIFGLTGEYDLRQLIILDPDTEAIACALSHLDPDQIVIGGYCTGSPDPYWKDVVDRAFYRA